MANILLAITICLCMALVQSTPFEECDGIPPPTDLRILGCTDVPCNIVRGTNVTAEWDFLVTSSTKTLKPKVRAFLAGSISVNYPLPQKNACDTLTNAECPLDEGEEVTYALHMPVLLAYPKIKLKIQFSLVDDDDNAQVCFKIDARVTDKLRI